MGDRCNALELTIPAEYATHEKIIYINDYLCVEDEISNGSFITYVYYDVNYGGEEQLSDLANSKIPFYGFHTEGGNYPSCVFASYDGEYISVPQLNGDPVVPVYRANREINQEDFDMALKYWELFDKVGG